MRIMSRLSALPSCMAGLPRHQLTATASGQAAQCFRMQVSCLPPVVNSPKEHSVAAMPALAPRDVADASKMMMSGEAASVAAQLKRLSFCMHSMHSMAVSPTQMCINRELTPAAGSRGAGLPSGWPLAWSAGHGRPQGCLT
jgi:hypothetical protein